MKVQNHDNKGNPYHNDATGEFTSAGDNSSKQNKFSNSAPSWLGGKNTNSNVPSWLGSKTTSNNTPAWLGGKNTNNTNSVWAQIAEDKWFQSDDVLSTDDVVKNIGRLCTNKEIVDIVAKYGWHTASTMGASKTSHSGINLPLLNAIAKKRFSPMTVLDDAAFDSLKRVASNEIGGLYPTNSAMTHKKYGYIERGLHDSKTINDIYLGQNLPDCILPNGCYGSGLYTAFDGYTAQSYAGSGYRSIKMEMIVDHSKANVITDNELFTKQKELINRLPELKNNIIQSMKDKGYSDVDSQRMATIFENNLQKDPNFTGVIMNYDFIYYGCKYGLGLKFKYVYTKKNWR